MLCQNFQRMMVVAMGAAVSGCAGGNLSLPTDDSPARMDVVSGDGQEATVGSRLPDPLVVRLTDAAARPVADAPVIFTFRGDVPDAEIDPASLRTDSTGTASVRVRLGTTSGAQIVEARVDSAAASQISATFGMTALQKQTKGGGGGAGEGNDEEGKHKGKGHHHKD